MKKRYRIVDRGSNGWYVERLWFRFFWIDDNFGFGFPSELAAQDQIDYLIKYDEEKVARNSNIKKPYEYP